MTFYEEFEKIRWYVTGYMDNGKFSDISNYVDAPLRQEVEKVFKCLTTFISGRIPTFSGIKEGLISLKQNYPIMKNFMFSAESYQQGINTEKLKPFLIEHYPKERSIIAQMQTSFSISHKLSLSPVKRKTVMIIALTMTLIVNRLLKQDAIKALKGELK